MSFLSLFFPTFALSLKETYHLFNNIYKLVM